MPHYNHATQVWISPAPSFSSSDSSSASPILVESTINYYSLSSDGSIIPKHPSELLKRYVTVQVRVNLTHDVLQLILFGVAQQLPQSVYVDVPQLVLRLPIVYRVEELEGRSQSVLLQQFFGLIGRYNELGEVHFA